MEDTPLRQDSTMISGETVKEALPSFRMVMFFVALGSPLAISIFYFDSNHPCRGVAEDILRSDHQLSSLYERGGHVSRSDAFYFDSRRFVDDVKYIYRATDGGRRIVFEMTIRGDCKSGDFDYEITYL